MTGELLRKGCHDGAGRQKSVIDPRRNCPRSILTTGVFADLCGQFYLSDSAGGIGIVEFGS